jgi:transcriptional regulator with XRE-family HTH domain
MTQAELGAPLTRSYVSAVERGRTVPSVPALAHMAARLGTNPGYLLPGVGKRPDPSHHGVRSRGQPPVVQSLEEPAVEGLAPVNQG